LSHGIYCRRRLSRGNSRNLAFVSRLSTVWPAVSSKFAVSPTVWEASRLFIVTDSGTESGGGAEVPSATFTDGAARAGRIRVTVAAWAWCALGGGGVYVLRDRMAAAVGLAAAVVMVACAAVVLVAVLFGTGDRRSPFVRFMLLVCVLTGRAPGEYLPPGPGEH
jgi:hypothetical protein